MALRSSWKTSRLAALILWLGGILWVAGMIWSEEPVLTLTTTLELWRSSTWRCWTLFFSATLQLQSSTPIPQNMLELLLKVHSTVSSPRWSILCRCILSTHRGATWTADLIVVDCIIPPATGLSSIPSGKSLQPFLWKRALLPPIASNCCYSSFEYR